MSLFVISDLHLSFASEKPMDIFGAQWVNHTEKIEYYWNRLISNEDTVLIPGDVSWGLKLDNAMPDLQWIHKQKGTKVFVKGNHDLWWISKNKLNKLFDDMIFIQNDFYKWNDYAICGTRGWVCPGAGEFSAHDEKIYLREVNRLRLSLESAKVMGMDKFIVALHYPPTNEKFVRSGFLELIEEYNVEKVVYGHLHGRDAFDNGIMGIRNGVDYRLTSCDYLKCIPLKIL